MKKLYVDIETYSPVELKRTSVYVYRADPGFRVQMIAYAWDEGSPQVVQPGDADWDQVLEWIADPAVLKVAHNAGFERVCLGPVGAPLDPASWECTAARCAMWGMPRALGDAAERLSLPATKEPRGRAWIQMFCAPTGKWADVVNNDEWSAHPDPAHPCYHDWMGFVRYCAQDVRTMQALDSRIYQLTPMEREVWVAEQRVNDRGVPVDMPLVRAGIVAAERSKTEAKATCEARYGVSPTSAVQLKTWLGERGYPVANTQKATLDELAASPDLPEDVADVLELRALAGGAAVAKYSAAARWADKDDRIRGGFAYGAAHTGRWAGRGIQPHNLPRACVADDLVEATRDEVVRLNQCDPHTLKALLRPTITSPRGLTVVDYSAIEARVLAWLAGEQWVLDAFAGGRDIYVETAERMSSAAQRLERKDGKVAVLALGYQGALGSMRAMGARGTDEHLRGVVAAWRAANPNIVSFWAKLEQAFEYGGSAGPVRVECKGTYRFVWLPSGRALVYSGVRREQWRTFDEHGKFTGFKQGIRFSPNKQFAGGRESTYGGKLTENVTQAVARDILAEALVRLDTAGLPVIAHIHDELVLEGRYDLEAVSALMCELPEWAAGLPLAGAGYVSARYKKD